MTIEQARQKAKQYMDRITDETEEKDAYIFTNVHKRLDNTIVVLKKDGSIIGYNEYVFMQIPRKGV